MDSPELLVRLVVDYRQTEITGLVFFIAFAHIFIFTNFAPIWTG